MNLDTLIEKIQSAISIEYKVPIFREIINSNIGCKEFNRTVRANVKDQIGVYIWENNINKEILYIGMSGKVKTNGEFVNHSVKKRLLASRVKDFNGKDIQTNQYVKNLLNQDNIDEMNIHVFHLIENQIPGYIEAVLLNTFFQENNRLPRYNSSF